MSPSSPPPPTYPQVTAKSLILGSTYCASTYPWETYTRVSMVDCTQKHYMKVTLNLIELKKMQHAHFKRKMCCCFKPLLTIPTAWKSRPSCSIFRFLWILWSAIIFGFMSSFAIDLLGKERLKLFKFLLPPDTCLTIKSTAWVSYIRYQYTPHWTFACNELLVLCPKGFFLWSKKAACPRRQSEDTTHCL